MNRLIRISTAAFVMLLCAMSLASACVLTGTVVNQRSGSPIKDARVMLIGIVPTPMATTDANGAYSLATAYEPGDSYTLQFQASGYALGNMPISLEIWRNQCRVTPGEDNGGTVEPADLAPLYTITGSVHTNSGLPINGASIKLTNDAIDDNSIAHAYENQEVNADVHGSFNFAAPMGTYTLEFQAAGYVPKQIEITLGDNTAARMDVALKSLDSAAKQRSNSLGTSTPTITTSLTNAQAKSDDVPAAQTPLLCILTGTITNQRSGLPIKGARLTLTGERDHSTAQTNAKGTYKFTQPIGWYAAGSAFIEIQALGYIGGSKTISLPLGAFTTGDCNQELNAALTAEPPSTPTPTPTPRPDPITTAYNNSVARYCKTAKQMACMFYQEHANACLGDAFKAVPLYRWVVFSKQQGLSSYQIIQKMSEGNGFDFEASDAMNIATAATQFIDAHRNDEALFSRIILHACLDNIAR